MRRETSGQAAQQLNRRMAVHERVISSETVWPSGANLTTMIPVLTREQSRQLDRDVIEGAGVPSVILMENAGRGAADVILQQFPTARGLLVVCGNGNNGGDGFVVARRWLTMGRQVVVCLFDAGEKLSPEATVMLDAYRAVGGCVIGDEDETWGHALSQSDVIVDALFGTGLTRQLQGVHAEMVHRINGAGKPVVALDLPSGLDADTGQVLGECVRATLTVTFGCAKRGCFTFGGAQLSGRVCTVDIGVPLPTAGSGERLAFAITREYVERTLRGRPTVGHKGQAGHVVVIGGSMGTLGAARLAAHGAFRAGAGVVTVATHADAAQALGSESWEVMVRAVGPDFSRDLGDWLGKATSVVFGPGLGVSAITRDWLRNVLTTFRGLVVLDADGLTLLSEMPAWRDRCVSQLVVTPHPGEAARLLSSSPAAIEADRFQALDALTTCLGATVVLKGAPSLVGDANASHIAPFGHSCLSTAGAGDVLAGIIGALGTRLPALDAALVGTWLHATAGEQLGEGRFAGRGLLAREIADEVSVVCASLAASR